jgi:hypothetical protein
MLANTNGTGKYHQSSGKGWEVGCGEVNLRVTAIRTPMATTLPYLAPLECSDPGEPSATKTIDLGRERMTVAM